ncbi:hypothetical protein [Chryseobacterium sp.]|uniref:hypothetical protein n=1 Tax=Chryseobacterium sp. TaxID=1871047 RepID=UPI0011CB8CFF|nr:hypothetical protein [Chryseobacterium sp.]TXF77669.1 hypothetical protein FUA25_07015 [Chryseobacterium sp.]
MNFIEFKDRLTDLTVDGNPFLKGSPLALLSINFSNKIFYGRLEKQEFYITKNANILLTPFLISGEFKKVGKFTDVEYEISPLKFGYYWMKMYPIITNVILLTIIIINVSEFSFQKVNLNFITIFIFIAVEAFLFSPLLYLKRCKIALERKFLENLEIRNR